MYWAHSDSDGRPPSDPCSRWQLLADHLVAVGDRACEFARAAAPEREDFNRQARCAGLLHDLGKYTDKFQRLLRGEVKAAPHSVYGAVAAKERRHADLAFVVAGHHGGMPDPVGLQERIRKAQGELGGLWDRALADCPQLTNVEGVDPVNLPAPSYDLWTRMLFSVLIDADRSDTAAHYGDAVPPGAALDPEVRLAKLLSAIEERARQVEDGPVKAARTEVLAQCLAAASREGSLFSLTVPTGGGKTLAAMAFALRRAALRPDRVRRIVVVIPYLSIIEQNARVYRNALGKDAILEHHSGEWATDKSDEDAYSHPSRRVALENWDAPIIVTTSVRFFESLFSNRPAALRRMHNLARSIVVLDEVQTLPRELIGPILSMIEGMAKDWQTTFVLSTATQPAFERRVDGVKDPRWKPGTLTEIVHDSAHLFQVLDRVEAKWPVDGRKKSWSEVAAEVVGEEQALVVVNTRRDALDVFEAMRKAALDSSAVFHLSNNMCPVHRLRRIDEIRARLRDGRRCVVVSTQLIEAGVDVDFPAVWRAMAPFDSIVQAAGRCDREGKLTREAGRPAGRFTVFTPAEGHLPKGSYQEGAALASIIAANAPSLADPEVMRAYFDRYYDPRALDRDEIEKGRCELRFEKVGQMRMIKDSSVPVVIPFDDDARALIARLRFGGLTVGVRRDLQRYAVNLWPHDHSEARALGIIEEIPSGSGFWVAREGFYREDVGLKLTPNGEDFLV